MQKVKNSATLEETWDNVIVCGWRRWERASPLVSPPRPIYLLIANGCNWNLLNKWGKESLWEVVRDGALGKGIASLLSLARKWCSFILIPGLSWPKTPLPRMLTGEELLFSLDQIQPEPHRQSPLILRSGFTNCLCHFHLAFHLCFMLWMGSCQCMFDFSSCTTLQTFLTSDIYEPYMGKFPGRINFLSIYGYFYVAFKKKFKPLGLVIYLIICLTWFLD